VNGARAVRGELAMSGPIRREGAAPRRPPPWEERASQWLFLFLSPKLPRLAPPDPPAGLAPFELDTVGRRDGGVLSATFYPAAHGGSHGRGGRARGAVLLLHPWLKWGRAYFHRYGRIEALRAAGYHTLTIDFPGFGDSDPTDGTYFDRAVEDALVHLRTMYPGLPVHVWGVSSGGYWMHPVLSRRNGLGGKGVAGAFFEDVSPHLLEWSWRMAPLGRPFYALFRLLYGRGYRYLDLRDHAPHLQARRLAYVSGALDPGVRPRDTRALAERAGAGHLLIPGADHLDSIKQAPKAVVELALRTFEGAE
jgi:pimeloyl-ACP methyl ester carboxylesterase